MKSLITAAAAVAAMAFGVASAATLAPTVQSRLTTTDGTTPIGPFGDANGDVLVGYGGPTPGSNVIESRGFFEFDLSSYGGSVSSAVLNLDARAFIPGQDGTACFDFTGCPLLEAFDLYFYSADGAITGSDFALTGAFHSGTVSTATALGGWVLDITSIVNSTLSSSSSFGVGLAPFIDIFNFNGGAGGAFFGATLDVNGAVPLPAGAVLFMSGMGIVTALRRKKQA